MKPEVKLEKADGILQLKIGLGVDLNKDGQNVIKASLLLELDEKEAIDELVSALSKSGKLPPIIAKLLGLPEAPKV